MNILSNASLANHSTMRVGGVAKYLAEINNRQELTEAVQWAGSQKLPIIMVGDGSNIVWKDEGFEGLVLVNRIMGFEVISEDNYSVYLNIGAGENWDNVVKRTVEKGLNGIAQLSLIPGTAGAAPVQNIGAYGQELSKVLVSVEAYDNQAKQLVNLTASDCQFSYRTSRFKTTDKGRFFITAITLILTKDKPIPPFYETVEYYFKENGITEHSVATLREAVVAIRSGRLPDPKTTPNNGSFFTNPVIDNYKLNDLLAVNPSVKYWHVDNNKVKISAAWMIEQCGFKGVHDEATGMATWPTQPLVLVNEKAHSTADVLAFKQKIVDAVQAKFRITLQQEPELLP